MMELMLYNGFFHTMDPQCPYATAALIRDGRYAAVGTKDEIASLATEQTVQLELHGAHVYPGMIDSHLHILHLAITREQLELNDVKKRADVFEMIRRKALLIPEGSVIDGCGFNQDLWDDPRMITRQELDAVAPHHAVRLTRVCGHMVVGNTLAMELAGINADTAAPDGGVIDYDHGYFAENAINLLFSGREGLTVEKCKERLYAGMTMAADAGLTAIYSDDFGTGGYSIETVAEAYRQLEQEGRMPVRVVQQCAMPDDASWQAFHDAGLRYGQGSDMYRIGPRKLYADGSLGARTAWLSVPYADQPDTTGVSIYPQEELNRLAEQTHREGMPFIVHAIGDAAAECVLNAIAWAREHVPGTEDLPSGIVHCQITTPELLRRIADMHACVYAQPVFTEYDLHICRDRVGKELEQSSYQWATLLHSGVCISSGSDCPVEPLDPAKNIYCAVTRKDFDHQPAEGWLPQERLTVEEAVACHTVQAARAAGLEDRLGKIAPGYLADATVFKADLAAIESDAILEQKPLMTMVGSRLRMCGAD